MSQEIALRENMVMDALELEAIKSQLSCLLENNPSKMEAFKTRILKISLTYMLKNCSPESIINCGLQALTLRLPLEAGQGYIVNYGGVACFDAGYKGWQVLAKRAGFSVLADVVYSCDEFSQDGYGFDREMVFNANFSERKGSNDKWAKANLVGVIVSIMEDETKLKTTAFVPADMIHKIVAKSPSTQTEKGKAFSPHENWAEQMFCAKAIKQVLTKFPIDIEEAASLKQAINFVNQTENVAQQQAASELNLYPQERFDENYPAWKELVSSGKKRAMAIITQLSNSYKLSSAQLEGVMTLRDFEPIDGQVEPAQQEAG